MPEMKFTKVEAGWYATEDGTYAVIADGYTPVSREVTDQDGITGGEWALAHDPAGGLRRSHQAGENIDWFPTKRQAIEAYSERRQS